MGKMEVRTHKQNKTFLKITVNYQPCMTTPTHFLTTEDQTKEQITHSVFSPHHLWLMYERLGCSMSSSKGKLNCCNCFIINFSQDHFSLLVLIAVSLSLPCVCRPILNINQDT